MNSCATMTNSTLFVFDTNTLVSALLFASSTPSLAFQKAQKSGFFVCSDETFAELSEVLMRPKFDRYLQSGKSPLIPESLRTQCVVDNYRSACDGLPRFQRQQVSGSSYQRPGHLADFG